MHDSLQELCAAFIENRETVKRVFKMESNYIYPICANVFCARGVRASEESLKDCKTLLKQKTGVFSTFRGYLTAPICCMLAAGRGPETRIEQALENYQALKERFWSSQYLALSAFLLADMGVGQSALDCVERGRRLYDRMKKEHPFLTSAEDCVYAVLMAFSDKGDDALIADMEACYQLIRKRFLSANSAQSVSHVLSLSPGTPEEKTDRLFRLFDGLREAGAKYGKDYRLSTLAAVSVLDGEPDQLVRDIIDTDEFLSGQKGYGFLSLNRKTRLMHAAMLVSDHSCSQDAALSAVLTGELTQTAAQNAVMTSTLARLAAQQAAMCAVITSSSVAASSASN